MSSQPDGVPDPASLMAVLVQIREQARESRQRVPRSIEGARVWDGLAFSIAGVRLVSSMREVREMTAYPSQITQVPGSTHWMKGLANIRGDLLPVVDLQAFFGAKTINRNKAARMLVVRMRGLECGLLVPAVQGIRYFEEDKRVRNARMKGAIGRYVYEAFSEGDEMWPVFSMSGLTADPAFRSAAT